MVVCVRITFLGKIIAVIGARGAGRARLGNKMQNFCFFQRDLEGEQDGYDESGNRS